MLTQLDRLVQLLESPIFTFLRMEVYNTDCAIIIERINNALFSNWQLLDGDNDLISAMYGILMLLPQSDAFNLVRYEAKQEKL